MEGEAREFLLLHLLTQVLSEVLPLRPGGEEVRQGACERGQDGRGSGGRSRVREGSFGGARDDASTGQSCGPEA